MNDYLTIDDIDITNCKRSFLRLIFDEKSIPYSRFLNTEIGKDNSLTYAELIYYTITSRNIYDIEKPEFLERIINIYYQIDNKNDPAIDLANEFIMMRKNKERSNALAYICSFKYDLDLLRERVALLGIRNFIKYDRGTILKIYEQYSDNPNEYSFGVQLTPINEYDEKINNRVFILQLKKSDENNKSFDLRFKIVDVSFVEIAKDDIYYKNIEYIKYKNISYLIKRNNVDDDILINIINALGINQ